MPGPRYAADAQAHVRRVDLGGLTALFHAPSGMTHIVAPPAPQILDALERGPGDPSEILARISEHFDINDEASAAAIEARLAELEAAGLVWRL